MSRTYYNLYPQIHHPLNLWVAYKNAARGKRYRPTVAAFEYDLEKNLIELEKELTDETYLLSDLTQFCSKAVCDRRIF